MRSPTLWQWIASNACDNILNFATDLQWHNVMNLSYIQNMCIVESLKLKNMAIIWGSPHWCSNIISSIILATVLVCLLLHNHPYCTWHIMLNCFFAWWFNYPGTLFEHQFGPLKLECNCLGGCNVRVWLELALAHLFNVEALDQACWVYTIIKVWCGWGRTLYGTCGSEHAHFM